MCYLTAHISCDDRLPYVEATILELLRYKSAVPAMTHRTLNDTEVGSYFIPRGTTVRLSVLYTVDKNSTPGSFCRDFIRGVRNPMKMSGIGFLKTEPNRTELTSKFKNRKLSCRSSVFKKTDFGGLGTVLPTYHGNW